MLVIISYSFNISLIYYASLGILIIRYFIKIISFCFLLYYLNSSLLLFIDILLNKHKQMTKKRELINMVIIVSSKIDGTCKIN